MCGYSMNVSENISRPPKSEKLQKTAAAVGIHMQMLQQQPRLLFVVVFLVFSYFFLRFPVLECKTGNSEPKNFNNSTAQSGKSHSLNDADEILMKYRFMKKPHIHTYSHTETLQSGPLIDNNMSALLSSSVTSLLLV